MKIQLSDNINRCTMTKAEEKSVSDLEEIYGPKIRYEK